MNFFEAIFHKNFLKKFIFGKPEILKINLVFSLNIKFKIIGNDVIN